MNIPSSFPTHLANPADLEKVSGLYREKGRGMP